MRNFLSLAAAREVLTGVQEEEEEEEEGERGEEERRVCSILHGTGHRAPYFLSEPARSLLMRWK